MIGGFMLTLVLAFLLYGIAETRQTATVTMGSTVLGAAWIALGLAHLLLLRDLPEHGRLAVFTVLLAVFADDTAAYLVGRLLGRHKLAPSLSPGKTWEGFVAGTVAAVAVAFFALYDAGLPDDPGVDRPRARDRARRRRRRPLRVGAQARPAGEGLGPAARRPRRHARPDRLAPLRRRGGVLRRPRLRVGRFGHTVPVRRVALLGATGSIGRQAIEVVERNPELELCALASGSTDLDGARRRARRRAHAGRRRSDGAARRRGAGRRPERRRRLRRRRRDAVGARARRHARAREQGEPRRRRRARARGAGAGRRPAAAGRQRALGALPVPRGPRRELRRLARPDRLRRAVPRPHARRARRRRRRGRARAPDLEHGAEDHGRLGDAREQGARADRGALPLRPPVRADRGRRPPDLDRARARPLPRRRRARAPRLSGHERADLVRAHLSGAGRDRRAAARPGRGA